MRLLIACPRCQRQYDAGKLPHGSRMHCHCGAVLVVQAPRGHESAVVRCSACGGPRQGAEPACGFCGADFTLHEQDRETVCPRCLTCVSNRARYCHSCGLAIVPESGAVQGAPTPLPCPACRDGRSLHSRSLGSLELSVLECGRCAGLWLGIDAFQRLADRAAREQLPEDALSLGRAEDAPETPRGYRPCAHCNQLMARRRYAQSSVAIDVCRQHGVWFDADELPRILRWIHEGREAAPVLANSPRSKQASNRPIIVMGTREPPESPLDQVVEAALKLLRSFFR